MAPLRCNANAESSVFDKDFSRKEIIQKTMKRDIESINRLIDRLVYELYGLTEEEIGIVEKG